MKFGIRGIRKGRRHNQHGYSLLALVIGLAITAMVMTYSVDTRATDRRRDRESEFIFRGCSIAKAIARYNNGGRIAPLNPGQPFPPELKDLTKETNLNGRKFFFLRPSAITDPFTGQEWTPIRMGDPRIKQYLENWESATKLGIPANYIALTAGISILNEGGGEGFKGGEFGPEGIEDVDSTGLGGPKRPVVGVVGTSKLPAFSQVFGKDVTYNEWIFLYGPPIPRAGQQAQSGGQNVIVAPDNVLIIATPCDRTFFY